MDPAAKNIRPKPRSPSVAMAVTLPRLTARDTLILTALGVVIAIVINATSVGSDGLTTTSDANTSETDAWKNTGTDTDVEKLDYVTNDLQNRIEGLKQRIQNQSSSIARVEQLEKDLLSLEEWVSELSNAVARLDILEGQISHVRNTVNSITAAAPKNATDAKAVVEEETSQSPDAEKEMLEARTTKVPASTQALPQQEDAETAQKTTLEETIAVASVEVTTKPVVSANRLRSTNEVAKDTRSIDGQDIVHREHKPLASESQGPWAINLASIEDKDAADRFAAKATAKGIPVEQSSVTFKGKEFWRIQVIGFLTVNDARTYAASAKEKLGLKETWVMKR